VSVGPSSPDDASIESALERAGDEVRSRPPSRGLDADEARLIRLEARDQAERFWAVTAERELLDSGGVRDAVGSPLKRAVRRLVRWYVEPALAEQRHYNAAVLRLLDDLAERMAALEERKQP
jgi:hypothetical protein